MTKLQVGKKSDRDSIITPLPSEYAGQLFRSRLEARWAIFFDALAISWEYEPEGYKLESGNCYLPDFRLTNISLSYAWQKNRTVNRFDPIFAEVKPHGGDFSKAEEFSYFFEIILLDGIPQFKEYDIVNYNCSEAVLFNIKKSFSIDEFPDTNFIFNTTEHAYDAARTARFENGVYKENPRRLSDADLIRRIKGQK